MADGPGLGGFWNQKQQQMVVTIFNVIIKEQES